MFNEPFVGSCPEEQLNTATKAFINDTRYNRLEGNTIFTSKIFKCFDEDFKNDIIGFFKQYASPELKHLINENGAKLKIAYLDDDWELNGK